ncbi:type II toxin-antitoxin system VapC family toxin [Enterobacteriaceae bacterium H11S18]|uniref:type II toxin-antitoxin system VapC family toxin n=1 Tax=Dryocola clanedunensis TaxID=2925396 RepID=UPI0022F01789|nr:type II toxin-antitoxin system VapC family toxin [Dryocola clanedunensis]MCT4713127.1 type II toxin-antitoxin system VapC family toxin [Dryocola clanedunensis]
MTREAAVFDTNILIDYLNGIPEAKATLAAWNNKPAISAITWMEVMVGAKKFGHEGATRHFLTQFEVLPVSQAVAQEAVGVRTQFGMKLPDAIILATTRVNGRRFVTRNSKDFERVPGVVLPY